MSGYVSLKDAGVDFPINLMLLGSIGMIIPSFIMAIYGLTEILTFIVITSVILFMFGLLTYSFLLVMSRTVEE